MATMITEVYEAFRKVGIPNPEAKQAAEALSAENVSTKADINAGRKEADGEYQPKVEKNLNAYMTKFSRRITEPWRQVEPTGLPRLMRSSVKKSATRLPASKSV